MMYLVQKTTKNVNGTEGGNKKRKNAFEPFPIKVYMKSFYSDMWQVIKVSEIKWRNPIRSKNTELKKPF